MMKKGIIGWLSKALLCLLIFTGKYSFAQGDSISSPEIDSSSLIVRVNVRVGCVISTFQALEFKFYPDSTCIKFFPERIHYTDEDAYRKITVPGNLWSRMGTFHDSFAKQENLRINYLIDNPEYTIEFELPTKQEFYKLFFEYKLSAEERMILSGLFDELETN
jgi:hypothetical protein